MKKIFLANKISGLNACVFTVSNLSDVINENNIRNKFHFPFYGLTLDIENDKCSEYVINTKYEIVAKKILKAMRKDGLSYFNCIKKMVIKETREFKNYCFALINKLPDFKDDELVDQFNLFMKQYNFFYGLGAITFIYEHIISDWLFAYLSKQTQNPAKILNQLLKSDYKNFITQSEDFLEKIKKEKNKNIKEKLVQEYIKNYFFIETNYKNSPKLTKNKVLSLVSKINFNKKAGSERLISPEKIKLPPDIRNMVNLLKITEVIHDQRKIINLIGIYTMFRFLEQGCQRKEINYNLAERAYWFEFKDLIFRPQNILPILKKRKYVSVILDGKKTFHLERIAIKELKKINKKMNYLKGNSAASGQAKGRIKIVFDSKDFKNFKKGDILVTEMTRPDFLPIIKNAKAVITDEGGLTCHAAIISRELKIPCIVGTKIATKVLKDGDLVEVDANKGIVKKLC